MRKRRIRTKKGNTMKHLILIRYGEIGLKGHNRHVFEKRLIADIRKRLGHPEIISHRGRIFVATSEEDAEDAVASLRKIPGIFSVSPSVQIESRLEEMKKRIAEIAKHAKVRTFKIEVNRANKEFEIKSPEVAAILGGTALSSNPRLKVDVHKPELLIEVEIREKTYVFTERIPCLGGMPYGSAGRVLSLFSGGIDSPVATYLMAKRGTEVCLLHFHSYPFTGPLAQKKVEDLAKVISEYTARVKLIQINLLEIQKAIKDYCPSEEMTVLSRCFMMKIATAIAEREKCSAIVTGESIGQVASQTMESMSVISSMTELPIFRPLIAFDKTEIIQIAREIGTFEISILPYEDCCTVFLPPSVVTKPRLEKIQKSLDLLERDALVERAVGAAQTVVLHADGALGIPGRI